MNLLISEKTIPSSPVIWIEKIAILKGEKVSSKDRIIPFTKGINIVWGVEIENSTGNSISQILSGHSVGKTSLCRLIRFCLGEEHFGTEFQERAIRNVFGKGAVVAKIHVSDSFWVVYRPFGKSCKSKAEKGMDFEACLNGTLPSGEYRSIIEEIERFTIAQMPQALPSETMNQYSWLDLLAWLARDQEARFGALWEWRSKRSESQGSTLKKDQALYLMRLVLGLLHEKDTKLRARIEEAEKRDAVLSKSIAHAQKEPETSRRGFEKLIADTLQLNIEDLSKQEGSTTSFEVLAEQKVSELEQSAGKLAQANQSLDDDILLREIETKRYEDNVNRLRAELIPEQAISSFTIGDRNKKITEIESVLSGYCDYSGKKIKDCSYTQEKLAELKEQQKKWENSKGKLLRDLSASEQFDLICQMRDDLRDGRQQYDTFRRELNDLKVQRTAIYDELTGIKGTLKNLTSNLKNWRHFDSICSGRVEHTELKKILNEQIQLQKNITTMKTQRNAYRNDYDQNLQSLTKIYNNLISDILTKQFSGTVTITGGDGELKFGIKQDAAFHGEAIETLSLVIADFAATLSRCTLGFHPGFLVHDSPREADLAQLIYDQYLKVVLEYSNVLGGPKNAPFQYIITTTSTPPKELKDAGVIVAQLKGDPKEEMLFGCSLRPAEAEQLEMSL